MKFSYTSILFQSKSAHVLSPPAKKTEIIIKNNNNNNNNNNNPQQQQPQQQQQQSTTTTTTTTTKRHHVVKEFFTETNIHLDLPWRKKRVIFNRVFCFFKDKETRRSWLLCFPTKIALCLANCIGVDWIRLSF